MARIIDSAVVGCGRMGCTTSDWVKKYAPEYFFPLSHADAINQHKYLNLKALCDTNNETLNKVANHFQVEYKFLDFNKMLQAINPELITIATRTNIRSHIIHRAYDFGVKAMHVEKPLCNSMRELLSLEKILNEEDFYFTWGAIRRYLLPYQQALKLVESGVYGKLQEIKINFGSSSLFWTHPHSIDLIIWAAGNRKLESIQAYLGKLDNNQKKNLIENDPEVLSSIFYFDDGVIGNITRGNGLDFILTCENAELNVRADGHEIIVYLSENNDYPKYKKVELSKISEMQGTLAPLNQLFLCLTNNKKFIKNNLLIKKDILKTQRICFAILQSHLQGSIPISLNEIDEDLTIMGKSKEGFFS